MGWLALWKKLRFASFCWKQLAFSGVLVQELHAESNNEYLNIFRIHSHVIFLPAFPCASSLPCKEHVVLAGLVSEVVAAKAIPSF